MWLNTFKKVILYVYVNFVSSLIKLLIVSAPFGGRDLS